MNCHYYQFPGNTTSAMLPAGISTTDLLSHQILDFRILGNFRPTQPSTYAVHISSFSHAVECHTKGFTKAKINNIHCPLLAYTARHLTESSHVRWVWFSPHWGIHMIHSDPCQPWIVFHVLESILRSCCSMVFPQTEVKLSGLYFPKSFFFLFLWKLKGRIPKITNEPTFIEEIALKDRSSHSGTPAQEQDSEIWDTLAAFCFLIHSIKEEL